MIDVNMQLGAQAKSTNAMDEFRQLAKSNPQLAMSALFQIPATHPLIAQGVSVHEVPATHQTIIQGVSMHQVPAVHPPIAQGISAQSDMGQSKATNRCSQCGGKIRSSPVRAWTGPLVGADLAVNPGNQANIGN